MESDEDRFRVENWGLAWEEEADLDPVVERGAITASVESASPEAMVERGGGEGESMHRLDPK